MSREIRVLHLEPTDVCQAACPACARETDVDFYRDSKNHLTLDQILSHISDTDILRLDKMFMCGNYGDPAAGKHTLEIYRYFREINPKMTLGMNTNGAIQNPDWWHSLGEIFHLPCDYVVFSIDGLEDTNQIYRKNVNWHKLMDNARAYISTGAGAHWDMLIYKHNEHQVSACEQLARDMGFWWFRAKVSKRPLVSGLEMPVQWLPPSTSSAAICCHALADKSIYIDAQGRVSPCCWLGSRQRDFIKSIDEVASTWNTGNPHPVCLSTCGGNSDKSNFSAQWRREVQLC